MSENMKQKLTSRKFWIAIAGLATSICLIFGYEEAAIKAEGIILMVADILGYVFAEAIVDSERTKNQ